MKCGTRWNNGAKWIKGHYDLLTVKLFYIQENRMRTYIVPVCRHT